MKFSRDMLEKALQRKIFSWCDSVMKSEIPSEIYNYVHQGTPIERVRANNWLKEHGYRLVCNPDGVAQVFRGATLVREAKVVLELDDPEDVLQLAEAVTENVNIPPPTWQPKNV